MLFRLKWIKAGKRSAKNIFLLVLSSAFIAAVFLKQQKWKLDAVNRNRERSNAFYVEDKLSVWPPVLEPSFGKHLIQLLSNKYAVKEEYEFVKSYLPTMLNRTHMVGNFCKNHPELAVPVNLPNLSWVIKKNITNIVWCCNFKVGSGTWTTNFLRVAHFNENNSKILALPLSERDSARFDEIYGAHYGTISKLFPEPETPEKKTEIFKNSIRLMSVRHPFTRILSGFRNIIESARPNLEAEEFYKNVRKNIIAHYRPPNSSNKSIFPTFLEFINYFINITRPLKTAQLWNTFLIENNGEYWEPFWSHCNVCASDFNVIVKLETMDKDEKFVTIVANLEEVKQRKGKEWKHMINGRTSYGLAHTYYKQLTRQQLMDLYEIYKYDFQLFGYDINYYLKLVRS